MESDTGDRRHVDRDRAQGLGLARGEEAAFTALYREYRTRLHQYALSLVRNRETAEDAVQDAFIKAYRRLDQFESRANFGTWLHRIAANCSYDLLRSRQRRSEMPLETEADESDARSLPSPEPSPDRLAHSADVRTRVERAMARLSPLERAAFVLRHHQGLSIREIGSALGLDTSATKHSIFRAVRKMREALEPVAEAAS